MERSDTTADDDSDTDSLSRRGFLVAGAAGSAIIGTGAVSAGALQSNPSASVTFNDQHTGGHSVTVQSVTLSNGGFVAIHGFDSVIGVSEKLDAGTHENVTVKLFEGVPGGEYDQEVLHKEQTLIAMAHLDTNDNGTYDFITSGGKTDGPYTNGGKPVVDKATITVKNEMMDDGNDENGGKNGTNETDGQQMPTASVTFNDQQTGGNSVTVQSITLSNDGFAAIHDSSLLDGNVLGSVIGVSASLDAGTHQNVDIALFTTVPGTSFDQSCLQRDQSLIAMAHRDTNDNTQYDFITTEGTEDGPYTANGQAVVDDAQITVIDGPKTTSNLTLNTADVCFLQGMIPHHKGAIEMAQLVAWHTDRGKLCALAQQIITAQKHEIEVMRELLERADVGAKETASPDCEALEMSEMMGTMKMDRLRELHGTAFDCMFIEMMISHHRTAIEMSQWILEHGQSAVVAELARTIIDAQRAEIDQMQQWYQQWCA